jgi:hypothetical protein
VSREDEVSERERVGCSTLALCAVLFLALPVGVLSAIVLVGRGLAGPWMRPGMYAFALALVAPLVPRQVGRGPHLLLGIGAAVLAAGHVVLWFDAGRLVLMGLAVVGCACIVGWMLTAAYSPISLTGAGPLSGKPRELAYLRQGVASVWGLQVILMCVVPSGRLDALPPVPWVPWLLAVSCLAAALGYMVYVLHARAGAGLPRHEAAARMLARGVRLGAIATPVAGVAWAAYMMVISGAQAPHWVEIVVMNVAIVDSLAAQVAVFAISCGMAVAICEATSPEKALGAP